jgi:hypothetical protein
MEVGLTDQVWSLGELVGLLEKRQHREQRKTIPLCNGPWRPSLVQCRSVAHFFQRNRTRDSSHWHGR